MKAKSLVVARLAPWIDKLVTIRTTFAIDPIVLRLVAVLPVGKEYMLQLADGAGVSRLVNVASVLEIAEVVS
ncbi:MAG: hypothetical protein AB7T06_41690 [Kofleriaceae bacterium]